MIGAHVPLLEKVCLLILDADGTLRRTTVAGQPCPRAAGEWELLPNVQKVMARVLGESPHLRLGVASNQDQIAYGHLSAETAYSLLRAALDATLGGASSLHESTIRFCPHALDIECECRKPAPGMLLDIMRHFHVAPARTLFVGDASTDAEAARRAGVQFTWAMDFFGCT